MLRWPIYLLAGHMWPIAGHMWPISGHMWPIAGHMWPISGHMWPIAGHLFSYSFVSDDICPQVTVETVLPFTVFE